MTDSKSLPVSPRSRLLTLILALLMFCLVGGLHRIYVGKVISGIIQLLTGGGFVIWQLIDIFRILIGCFDDKEGRLIL